ncbi:MAG: diadenylate cyclase CdaA [Lachnospiraceae bacterium]|nr:diadenylate cyclase CdaA [Lachnospiraceae bacterium]MCR5269340.1 diadenylate cyclase CdaA [Lachnospiraceae bacterium]
MDAIVERFSTFSDRFLTGMSIPHFRWTDGVEILIIAFLLYHLFVWIRNTKAWSLTKGLAMILIFVIVANLLHMTTILWIVERVFGVAVTALVVVFQPELRRALEQLGRKNILSSWFRLDNTRITGELFSDHTIEEIIKASYAMGRAKTGALIVVENRDSLTDYEKTGIRIDSVLSSPLLINIFEHNTPLHDGAVIVRENRIVSATCYLPLSDNMELSKDLGTRHRAGVGISEMTDSLTIIVSEETGRVSIAQEGFLYSNVDMEFLREKLTQLQNKVVEEKRVFFRKGRSKNEKTSDR